VVTVLALVVAVSTAAPAAEPVPSSPAPIDSAATPLDEARLEDALLEDELEPGEIESSPVEGAHDRGDGGGLAARLGLIVARGATALRLHGARGAIAADGLFVRERGEPRAIDDAFVRVSARLGARGEAVAGWLAPRLGSELVIGRRRAFSERPFATSAIGTARVDAMPGASPATAASGLRGVWLRRALGRSSLAVLAADTPRDARPSGEAWWPVASALHRTPTEAARRGAARERVAAVTVATPIGPPAAATSAWLVVAHARTSSRRATPVVIGTAGEVASGVTRGGAALEIGVDLARSARLALALDAHGRARTRASWTLADEARTVPQIAFASEASGFTPLLARSENLPRAHVAARLRTRFGRSRDAPSLGLEAYAMERGPLQTARAGVEASVRPRAGVELALARDAEPKRTLASARWSSRARTLGAAGRARVSLAFAAAADWRFDAKGLARESWRAEVRARGPGGAWAELETRLASGRSGFAVVELDVPGGTWTRRARGAARTRLSVGQAGARVEPRAAIVWLADGVSGGAVEGRFALEVALGPRR
jgi:hypothetical protein